MRRIIILCFVALAVVSTTRANISLPAIFGDHMVMQQNAKVTIWGWAKPMEEITITASWDPDKQYIMKVESQGSWKTSIETPSAGGPYELTLKGHNTIEIRDILIGEVWLGSGQSNMEWTPHSKIDNAEAERDKANFSEIRFFTVFTSTASSPQQHLVGEWVVCTPETMWDFSAIMYFFGRELYQNLQVPVGLINASWGGTPLEVWVPEPIIRNDRILSADADKLKPIPWGPYEPGKAYNAMINPLIPYKIKGALWYQGEANVGFPTNYARALTTLIQTWRAAWGDDFSFYYAQIAPYNGYGTDNVNGAILRDQQRKVLDQTAKTGMVVLSDIGDLDNIHPGNKQEAGKRLANWALNRDYGMAEKVFSGPLYRSYEIEKGNVIIHFAYAEHGLMAKDGDLKEFEVLDDEGTWVPAEAIIKKNTVVIGTGADMPPRGVRFGYSNNSNPNLFNTEGLPASCFKILL